MHPIDSILEREGILRKLGRGGPGNRDTQESVLQTEATSIEVEDAYLGYTEISLALWLKLVKGEAREIEARFIDQDIR